MRSVFSKIIQSASIEQIRLFAFARNNTPSHLLTAICDCGMFILLYLHSMSYLNTIQFDRNSICGAFYGSVGVLQSLRFRTSNQVSTAPTGTRMSPNVIGIVLQLLLTMLLHIVRSSVVTHTHTSQQTNLFN